MMLKIVTETGPRVRFSGRVVLPYRGIPGVASVAFVGKDEALQRLGKQLGQDSFFLGRSSPQPVA